MGNIGRLRFQKTRSKLHILHLAEKRVQRGHLFVKSSHHHPRVIFRERRLIFFNNGAAKGTTKVSSGIGWIDQVMSVIIGELFLAVGAVKTGPAGGISLRGFHPFPHLIQFVLHNVDKSLNFKENVNY